MKATPEEYALHQRMVAGDDPIAFAELAEWLYIDLVNQTMARAKASDTTADAMLVEEAVGTALLAYNRKPTAYDPDKLPLRNYLIMAAYRDFQNARAKENRRPERQLSSMEAELALACVYDAQDLSLVESNLEADQLWQAVEAAFSDPVEREIVRLIVEGVRSPEPYAQLLGITEEPVTTRVKHVQRVKDRIVKRLRRVGGTLDGKR